MDIHTLASDKAFLAQLTTEYEQLKRSGGHVKYDVWIRERLKSAAAGLQTGRGTLSGTSLPVWQGKELTNMPGAFSAAADAASTLAPSAPSWAVAAKLQQSLQGSGAVSLLNAPAERRRRLALAAAVARQQVQLGVEPPTAAAAVVAPAAASTPAQGPAPQAADAVKAELGRWMERLADQNQQLQAAVVGQQEQLQKQQALLQQVLETRVPAGAAGVAGPVYATPQTSSAQAAAGSVGGVNVQPAPSNGVTDAVTAAAGPAEASSAEEAIRSSWLVQSAFGDGAGTQPQPQKQQAGQQPPAAAAAPPGNIRASVTAQPGQPRSREQVKALLRELLLGGSAALQPLAQPSVSSPSKAAAAAAAAAARQHAHLDREPAAAVPRAAGGGVRSPRGVQAVGEAPRRSKAAASPTRSAAGGQSRGWDDTPYTPPPPRLLKRKGVGHVAWVPPEPAAAAARSPSAAAATSSGPGKPKPGASKRLGRASSSSGGSTSGGVEWHAVHVVRPSPQLRHRSPPRSPPARSPGGGSRMQAEWAQQEEARRLQKMQVLYSSMVSLAERLEQHLDLVRGAPPARASPGRSGHTPVAAASGRAGRQPAAATGRAGAAAAGAGELGGAEASAQAPVVPGGMEDVLQQMLRHMEQLQQQEEEVRQRWFCSAGPPEAAAAEAAAGAAGVVGAAAAGADSMPLGVASTSWQLGAAATPPPDASGSSGVHKSSSSSSMMAAPALTGEHSGSQGVNSASCSAPDTGLGEVDTQQEPARVTEQGHVKEQVVTEHNRTEDGEAAGSAAAAAAALEELVPAGPASAAGWVPAITPELVAEVEAGRRRFLRHQQARTQALLGDLAAGLAAGEGAATVQPLQLLEVVADALAEEVVEQQLAEVDGLCDLLCEQLLQAEFADA